MDVLGTERSLLKACITDCHCEVLRSGTVLLTNVRVEYYFIARNLMQYSVHRVDCIVDLCLTCHRYLIFPKEVHCKTVCIIIV